MPFRTFVDYFKNAFWVESAKKQTLEKVADWVKKKDLLDCKYKVTFQPDGCAESTCAATCFIHFGFGYRLDNIRL